MIIALGNNIFKQLNEFHRLYERFSFWTKEVSENKLVRSFEFSSKVRGKSDILIISQFLTTLRVSLY